MKNNTLMGMLKASLKGEKIMWYFQERPATFEELGEFMLMVQELGFDDSMDYPLYYNDYCLSKWGEIR